MSCSNHNPEEAFVQRLKRWYAWLSKAGVLLGKFFWRWVINVPLVAWAVRTFTRIWVTRRLEVPALRASTERVAASGLDATLRGIVQDVVDGLGYVAAMVATYEQGDVLPVRALYVDPDVASEGDLRQWERAISRVADQPASITDAEIARVYVYRAGYEDNLSVKAARAGHPVTSPVLHDLFVPIAPSSSKPIVDGIQQALNIKQVIAVPFFLETHSSISDRPDGLDGQSGAGEPVQELVGNLFAAKCAPISADDVRVLSAFGRQAAAAIKSERHRLQVGIVQKLIFRVQTSLHDESEILKWIARGVVLDLGYVGAMVATYEANGALPVRALYVDPDLATEAYIQEQEEKISRLAGRSIRVTDPNVARVYVHQDAYRDNLSVKAAEAGRPVTSDALYDLFRPIAPAVSAPVVQGIQEALGIQQVIAVPFFLEVSEEDAGSCETDQASNRASTKSLVGNLFAATRSRSFKPSEIELLRVFGQQAAAGIRNARLYQRAEEQRQAAQIFGKMAFSATASVHALRNHLTAFRMHIQLLKILSPEERDKLCQENAGIEARLAAAADILEALREPWRRTSDEFVDVNVCLKRALDKAIATQDAEQLSHIGNIDIALGLSEEMLAIKTSVDMLSQAFQVLIKNAIDAIQERGRNVKHEHNGDNSVWENGKLTIKSSLDRDAGIQVWIQDNGTGIRQEHLSRIFDIGWTTKTGGMGFGLFWTKDYIEGLGGCIRVESVWQEGTVFQVCLPSVT